MAAIVSLCVLILVALFVPSLHKTLPPPAVAPLSEPGPASAAPATAPAAAEQPPVLPSAPFATEAAPLPTPQGLQDVDPHKAFGSKSAPVVMEEFSDYQCPACKTLYTTTNRLLMDNYVSTGKVYLIHRDFPLANHAYSRTAARYARAAASLGKVEPVEQTLFQ